MFGQEPTIFRVSLIRRLARLARIRFAGQRLPYPPKCANETRARQSRQMPHKFVSARKLSLVDWRKVPGISGRICKAEKSKTGDRSDTQFVAVDAGPIKPVSPCIFGKCREIFAKCREAERAVLLKSTRSQ